MTEKEFENAPLYQVLRVALADLERLEKDDQYMVHMEHWHAPNVAGASGPCYACLAGSVMVGTLGAKPWEERYPEEYPLPIRSRLIALNRFRKSAVWMAVREHYGRDSVEYEMLRRNTWESIDVPDYDDNPEGFKDALQRVADQLEKLGL